MTWLPLAAALAFAQATAAPKIGVAAGRDGQVCLAIDSSRLAPGSIVTIVDPDEPQSVRRAIVRERLASCAAFEASAVNGVYYRLQLQAGDMSPIVLAIAFVGAVASTAPGSGTITFHLTAAYPRARVRSCTSSEGVHLTVWAGEPLKSRRLWHQYFHLNYDVEPSCEDADVREPLGSVAHANALLQPEVVLVGDFLNSLRQKSTIKRVRAVVVAARNLSSRSTRFQYFAHNGTPLAPAH